MARYVIHRLKSGDYWIFDNERTRSTRCRQNGNFVHGPDIPYVSSMIKAASSVVSSYPLLFRPITVADLGYGVLVGISENNPVYAKIILKTTKSPNQVTLEFYRSILGVLVICDGAGSRFLTEWTEECYDTEMPSHITCGRLKHVIVFE